MSSTSNPKRKESSLSSGADVGKRPKRSRSVLPVEEADQRGNAEGGEGTLKNGSRSLLSGEEADQRDNAGGGEIALKKGPWTKEEDEILVDHIKKHGEGNWNAVQKESGLARCGKSCRLRWSNHLRPGLKRGSFTAEEEHKILNFHFRNGSKWAQMAALLPGRTDNEIKNFWYTRSKKRQRAGLPIYPDEITSKYSLNGSQESADTLPNESSQHDETQTFNLDITDLDLKYYKFCPDMLPPIFDSQDYKPISDLVRRCSDSSHNTLSMPSAVVRQRYLFSSSSAAVPEVFDQYGQYPMLSTPCDPILNTNLLHGYDNPITGFHAASKISLSEPINGSISFEHINGSMRLEPPSFQNLHTQQCSWSPLPSFESVDKLVQSSPIETRLPVPDSLDCSHLIDPIVYYNSDQNLKGSNTDSLQANTDSMAPNEADISTQWNEIVTCQINFLRRVRSEMKNTQRYYINRGAINDQLPAYYTSNKEDNLNQKGLVLPEML